MNLKKIFLNKRSTLIFQVITGVILALIFFLIFAKLTDIVFEKERIFFDQAITQYIYSFRNAFNTKFMLLISNFGSYGVAILSLFITFFLILKKYYNLAIYFIFVVGTGFVANALLKLMIQRPRPIYLPLAVETDFSFPSGHAMGSFIFFITVVYLYYHITKQKRISLILLLISMFITILIGISRIYLGVHYPSDILGGFVAGLLWFIGIITVNKVYVLSKH